MKFRSKSTRLIVLISLFQILICIESPLSAAPTIETKDEVRWIRSSLPLHEKTLIVMIHGWGGNPVDTWLEFPVLLDLVLEKKYDIALIGYPTGIFDSPNPSLYSLSRHLENWLNRKSGFGNNADYKNYIFIAHSFGGLLVKQFVVDQLGFGKKLKTNLVFLIGVPNLGDEISPLAVKFPFLPKRQLTQLQDTDFLSYLHLRYIVHTGIQRGRGVSATVVQNIQTVAIYGNSERDGDGVVSEISARTFFPELYPVTKDHVALVKPKDITDAVFVVVRDKISSTNFLTDGRAIGRRKHHTSNQFSKSVEPEFDEFLDRRLGVGFDNVLGDPLSFVKVPGNDHKKSSIANEKKFTKKLASKIPIKLTSDLIKKHVIFVHGFFGGPETWENITNLLSHDSQVQNISFSTFNYETPLLHEVNIDEIVSRLRINLLEKNDLQVYLVCHSMGTIICQESILQMLRKGQADLISVEKLLLFSPLTSTPNLLNMTLFSSENLQLSDLKRPAKLLSLIAKVQKDWFAHISKGGDPKLSIKHRKNIKTATVVGIEDSFSEKEINQLLFDQNTVAPGDHLSIAKPSTRENQVYEFLIHEISDYPD